MAGKDSKDAKKAISHSKHKGKTKRAKSVYKPLYYDFSHMQIVPSTQESNAEQYSGSNPNQTTKILGKWNPADIKSLQLDETSSNSIVIINGVPVNKSNTFSFSNPFPNLNVHIGQDKNETQKTVNTSKNIVYQSSDNILQGIDISQLRPISQQEALSTFVPIFTGEYANTDLFTGKTQFHEIETEQPGGKFGNYQVIFKKQQKSNPLFQKSIYQGKFSQGWSGRSPLFDDIKDYTVKEIPYIAMDFLGKYSILGQAFYSYTGLEDEYNKYMTGKVLALRHEDGTYEPLSGSNFFWYKTLQLALRTVTGHTSEKITQNILNKNKKKIADELLKLGIGYGIEKTGFPTWLFDVEEVPKEMVPEKVSRVEANPFTFNARDNTYVYSKPFIPYKQETIDIPYSEFKYLPDKQRFEILGKGMRESVNRQIMQNNEYKKIEEAQYKMFYGPWHFNSKLKGGYTGTTGGIVHPFEMVMNPSATKKYFNLLEKMNNEGRGRVGISVPYMTDEDMIVPGYMNTSHTLSSLFNQDAQPKAYSVPDKASLAMDVSLSKSNGNQGRTTFEDSPGYNPAPYNVNVNLFATLEKGISLTTDNVSPRVMLNGA
jgi:hypothetical protein